MKRYFYFSALFGVFVGTLLGSNAFAEKILYDNFQSKYISSQKWNNLEFVAEVDPTLQKLVSKLASKTDGIITNDILIANPNSVFAVECLISISETSLGTANNQVAYAAIYGTFYNAKPGATVTGDIQSILRIEDQGNGLEATWLIIEALDDNWDSHARIASGTLILPGTLTYGTAYQVKLEYNGSDQFMFTVAGQTAIANGPSYQRPVVTQAKGLRTLVYSDSPSGRLYISALFDDVYINNQVTPYDTFDTPPLNLTKWWSGESVREISDGSLQLNLQRCNQTYNMNIALVDNDTPYLEAKALIESGSQVIAGATGAARVGGYYYNDSRGLGSGLPYNGFEGDIWGEIRLQIDGPNNLVARCFVWRWDSAIQSLPGHLLFEKSFNTPITFDTQYALSIKFADLKFIFKCNNENYQYDIITPTYPPHAGQYRELVSRVYLDSGECSYLKARFDDVYVEEETATAIPTINQFGMIVLSLLMVGSVFWVLKRRKRVL